MLWTTHKLSNVFKMFQKTRWNHNETVFQLLDDFRGFEQQLPFAFFSFRVWTRRNKLWFGGACARHLLFWRDVQKWRKIYGVMWMGLLPWLILEKLLQVKSDSKINIYDIWTRDVTEHPAWIPLPPSLLFRFCESTQDEKKLSISSRAILKCKMCKTINGNIISTRYCTIPFNSCEPRRNSNKCDHDNL